MSVNVEAYLDWRDYYELTKPRVVMLIVPPSKLSYGPR